MQTLPHLWWIFAVGSLTISLLVWISAVMFVRIQRRRFEAERSQMAEIRRREEKYKSIFDSSIAGLVRIDLANGAIVEANNAALSITGCAGLQELGSRFFAEHRSWLKQLLQDLRRTLIIDQREFEFLRTAGMPAHCLISARLNQQDGTADLVLVDISEQKRLHQNLMHAHRMELMGTLAAGIAHDVNNILTPMSLSVEQLERVNTQSELRRTIETFAHGVDRARSVADQFLTIARGVSISPAEVHPETLIHDTVRLLATALPKSIVMEIVMPAKIWTVSADYTQVQQVLMNLCINARDAMPAGGHLRIVADNIASGHPSIPGVLDSRRSYVVVRVEDTGDGIPPEHLERIFDPFFTTKPPGSGTGLGLSMCQQILAQHQGTITVASTPGSGSAFAFWLVTGGPSEPAVVSAPGEPIMPGDNSLLLVIDDEPGILLAVDEMLTSAGYRVLTAQDGEEGLMMFSHESAQIAAVVCDMMMPTLAGPPAIRRMRAASPFLPVVAMSGLNLTPEMMKEFSSPTFAYLRKPFKRHQLLEALSTVRRGSSRRPEDDSTATDV